MTRLVARAAIVAACAGTYAATPANAQTVASRQSAPAAIVLDVPSNPDHAEPAALTVVSYEYDAAASRLTYARGYDSAVTGSFVLKNTEEPVPIASPSLLKWVTVRESNGGDKIVRRVTFHGVRVLGIARDGNDRRVSFTAESVTVR